MTLADTDPPCCPAIQQAIVERAAHPFYGYQQFDEVLPERVCALGEGPQYGESGSADDSDYTGASIPRSRCACGADAAGRWNSDPESVYSPVSRKVAALNQRRCVINELIQKGDHYELDLADFEAKLS